MGAAVDVDSTSRMAAFEASSPFDTETLGFELGKGPMRAEHERLLRTALRRGRAPEDMDPTIEVEAYDPVALGAARKVWRQRMVNEHHSAAVFSAMLPQMMACGAALPFKTTLMRMAMDELRHGALCARVVAALGGEPTVEVSLRTQPLPEHPGCTPLETALRNSMFVGCLAETVAVAFTAEERERTQEPFVKAVITQISADESLHARFGWAFAKEAAPHLDDDARARTDRWLRTAFAYLEREEMREVPDVRPPSEELRDEGLRLGVCENPATRELFYETVREAILPGLEALGFAAHAAWKERARA